MVKIIMTIIKDETEGTVGRGSLHMSLPGFESARNRRTTAESSVSVSC